MNPLDGINFRSYAKKVKRLKAHHTSCTPPKSRVSFRDVLDYGDSGSEGVDSSSSLREAPGGGSSYINYREYYAQYRKLHEDNTVDIGDYNHGIGGNDSVFDEFKPGVNDRIESSKDTSSGASGGGGGIDIMTLTRELASCDRNLDHFGCIVFLSLILKTDSSIVVVSGNSDESYIGCDSVIRSTVDRRYYNACGENGVVMETVEENTPNGIADAVASVLYLYTMSMEKGAPSSDIPDTTVREWLTNEVDFLVSQRLNGKHGSNSIHARHILRERNAISSGVTFSAVTKEVVESAKTLIRVLILKSVNPSSSPLDTNAALDSKNEKRVLKRIEERAGEWGF